MCIIQCRQFLIVSRGGYKVYLNSVKIASSKVLNGILIAVVSLPTFFNGLFVLFALVSEKIDRFAGLIVAAFIFVFFAAGVCLIVWRSLALYKLSRARIYNSIFEEDHDGIISYESIATMTGLPMPRVIKELMWFTRRDFIRNVTLGRNAVRVNVLSNEHDFLTVSCPTCGAHVQIRRNGGGRCNHCGTFMRAKGEGDV